MSEAVSASVTTPTIPSPRVRSMSCTTSSITSSSGDPRRSCPDSRSRRYTSIAAKAITLPWPVSCHRRSQFDTATIAVTLETERTKEPPSILITCPDAAPTLGPTTSFPGLINIATQYSTTGRLGATRKLGLACGQITSSWNRLCASLLPSLKHAINCTIADPSAGRRLGIFESMSRTNASNSYEFRCLDIKYRSGLCTIIFASTASTCGPSKAGRPTRHSYKTHPSENISARASIFGSPCTRSGAM